MARQDEDAPWLAEAAPLQPNGRRRPLLNMVIIVLALAAVAAVALLMLLGRKDGGSQEGYMEASQAPLIEADPGPYKVAPADRQGMDVAGDGEVIHEAVRGQGIESRIDLDAVPEAPIGRPRDLLPPQAGAPTSPASPAGPAAGQPVPVQVMPAQPAPAAPASAPARALPAAPPAAAAPPKPTAPAPKPTAPAPQPTTVPPAAGGLVQIGAFSSEAKAEEEWARVAGKGGLSAKRIEKLTNSEGRTLWRVRGTAADPAAACKAILAARGACEAVRK
jgi:cell division septation protein DedD